jgi:hypothetical protein
MSFKIGWNPKYSLRVQKIPRLWNSLKWSKVIDFFEKGLDNIVHSMVNLLVKELWKTEVFMKSYKALKGLYGEKKKHKKGLEISLWIMIQFSNGFF